MRHELRTANPFPGTRIALALVAALVGAQAIDAAAGSAQLKAATMIIEYNASAEDIGIQFFLDSDGWRSVDIRNPADQSIFSATTRGSIAEQGGGTELFLESVEPPIDELPLEVFFERFPEGVYRFQARDADGNLQRGRAVFSHAIPAAPVLTAPLPDEDSGCAEDVELPVVIAWEPVAVSIDDEPLDVVRYELIVENDTLNFDVRFPAGTGTQLTVSPELLEPGTEYLFEILAVEKGGNQTITEGCFTTAP